MELTDNEKRLIITMRKLNEIPINFLLWYETGKKASLKKLTDSVENGNDLNTEFIEMEKIKLEKILESYRNFDDIKID